MIISSGRSSFIFLFPKETSAMKKKTAAVDPHFLDSVSVYGCCFSFISYIIHDSHNMKHDVVMLKDAFVVLVLLIETCEVDEVGRRECDEQGGNGKERRRPQMSRRALRVTDVEADSLAASAKLKVRKEHLDSLEGV